LVEKYGIDIKGRPHRTNAEENPMNWHPKRHFGTFLEELRKKETEIGEEGIRALTCPYGS
jgi:hypothetical protein